MGYLRDDRDSGHLPDARDREQAGAQEADRDAESRGYEILGVFHSHTHTDAYPSPTDVEKASNPFLVGWRWVLVSLKPPEPVVRSYFVVDGRIEEEPIELIS